MRERWTTMFADGDPGAAAGTKIMNIRIKDPISQIMIRFHSTAGSTTISEHPASNLTKIEIVDGSDVLYSLNGQEAEAMDFYGITEPRPNRIYYRNGEPWVTMIHINFGRYAGDRELALDPRKFTNLQLKVSYNEDVANTSGGSRKLFVKALIFDEDPPDPIGFLMMKELKAYTPVAAGWEYTDLPVDYAYRTIAIQNRRTGTRYGSEVSTLKLSEDNDTAIPYEDHRGILAQMVAPYFGWYKELIIAYVGTAPTNVYFTPSLDVAMGLACQGNNYAVQGNIVVGCIGTVARATAAGFVQINAGGYLPHGVLALPFGNRNIIKDWYDMSAVKNLRLSLLGGAGAGTTETSRIIGEQLRLY